MPWPWSVVPVDPLFGRLVTALALTGPLIFVFTSLFPAPYGRYKHALGSQRRNRLAVLLAHFGASLPPRIAWFLMESPALFVSTFCFFTGTKDRTTHPALCLAYLMYAGHYFNRSILYPLSMNTQASRFPLLAVVSGIIFNIINGGVQGLWLGHIAPLTPVTSQLRLRLFLGAAVFLFGFFLNKHADKLLSRLRKPGETDYKIPHGGIFNYVTAGNYTAETIEWIGFAIVQGGLPAVLFVFHCFCYFGPRAYHYHKWYHRKFRNYPPHRKRLIPFVW